MVPVKSGSITSVACSSVDFDGADWYNAPAVTDRPNRSAKNWAILAKKGGRLALTRTAGVLQQLLQLGDPPITLDDHLVPLGQRLLQDPRSDDP
jgi:hypothetical protein